MLRVLAQCFHRHHDRHQSPNAPWKDIHAGRAVLVRGALGHGEAQGEGKAMGATCSLGHTNEGALVAGRVAMDGFVDQCDHSLF